MAAEIERMMALQSGPCIQIFDVDHLVWIVDESCIRSGSLNSSDDQVVFITMTSKSSELQN